MNSSRLLTTSALLASVALSCFPNADPEGRPCDEAGQCASGFFCCQGTNQCLRVGNLACGQSPVANAGVDQNASFAERLTLDGTQSADPEKGSLTYSWQQTAGPAVTLSDPSSATPTFDAPNEVATLVFSLTVNVGERVSAADEIVVRVWVDKSKVVLVSGGGDDSNSGDFGTPVLTLAEAINKAALKGPGAAVYAAAGTYFESITVPSGVAIYGGFDPITFNRDIDVFATILRGGSVAVNVTSASGVILNGLTVESAAGSAAGESAVGVLISQAQDVEVSRCTIRAGDGAPGNDAFTPIRAPNGMNGAVG
ncbi:MAG TPA: hypothetical protein VE782_15805, partial [Myxococcaceae bacterium]|nr:hypothetical protein [Myxococcaceae bacterium]